jgi:hypothetical protein
MPLSSASGWRQDLCTPCKNAEGINTIRCLREHHRLVDKYMRQPYLMKLTITNINEIYLSSDIVSIAFAYFLNPPHSSLKYAIEFFLIDTPQHLLQGPKKLILVSHLNPFEFFFHRRK